VCASLLPARDRVAADSSIGGGSLARTLLLYRYEYPVDHFIRALKFRGERVYARVLGTLLAHARADLGGELPGVVIPVPLHSERYRRRGFNQAEEIARFAARRLGLEVDSRCLRRRIATREQSGLTVAERRRNVRGAFELRHVPRATRVALVDDVVTTGSTAMAAARTLQNAGISEIELWAAARVEIDP